MSVLGRDVSADDDYSFDSEYPQSSQDETGRSSIGGGDQYVHPCDTDVSSSLSLINSTAFRKSAEGITAWLLTPDLFTRWTPLHHMYFQLANTCLLLYFLFCFSGKCPAIGRLLATLYSILMILWGYFALKSMDIIAWNGALLVISLGDLFWRICSFCCGTGAGLCRRGFGKDVVQVLFKILYHT